MPLSITIPEQNLFNNETNEFLDIKATTLTLEHSLRSIAKWESKWHKPYLSEKPKTKEEIIDYIRCMTITSSHNPVDDVVYYGITDENAKDIQKYIDDPMTATTFREDKRRGPKEVITSELIYYWMVYNGIPFECQNWHINRLLTLIRVCSIKNAPSKKMSSNEILKQNHALNQARKAKYNTHG